MKPSSAAALFGFSVASSISPVAIRMTDRLPITSAGASFRVGLDLLERSCGMVRTTSWLQPLFTRIGGSALPSALPDLA